MNSGVAPPRTIFVLVDGLGLGPSDPAVNPVRSGACPTLERLLDRRAVALDACMGVPGLPQSATGQTALLTGINAAAPMGRHVEGFPGPTLRELIRKHNLYDRLRLRGYSSTFANAYYVSDVRDVFRRRLRSATTVAALHAFGAVRDTAAMLRNEAVYQDLTRESLRARGYDGPTVTAEDAARHLVAVASKYDLTLFEYFQTDRAGHRGVDQDARGALGLLDRFLATLLRLIEAPPWLFVLTSDHGNVEDIRSRGHTANPVPLVAVGSGEEALRDGARSILDVAPALLRLYPQR